MTAIIGRDAQIGTLTALLDDAVGGQGRALVVRGEAGIGKSALLQLAAGLAGGRGIRVLSASGVQAEVHIPFAGLSQLVRPLPLDLESPFRTAVELLERLSSDAEPVLLAVEDAHWLDRASWDVLTFLARRIESDRIAVIMTARDGVDVDQRLAGAGLPELRLEPLSAADAGALLDRTAPGLAAALRTRVLDEAAGNPLGVVELGAVAARSGGAALLPSWLPLSTRVERTFAGLVAELPEPTRTLLLVAALDDGDDLDEVLAAAGRSVGRVILADDVQPAVVTRLVTVDDLYRIRFRHPLLRSALRQSAGAAQRRRVHDALAAVVADPDRQLWHRAAAAAGPDQALADELAALAVRVRDQQAVAAALAAMERAAQLSEDPEARGRRLMLAAYLAHDQGDAEGVRRLSTEIDDRQLRPGDRARLAWLREVYLASGWTGGRQLRGYADLIDTMRRDGDAGAAVDSLASVALRIFYSAIDDETRDRFLAVADAIETPARDPRIIAALATIAPVDRGAACLGPMAALLTRLDLTTAERHDLAVGSSAMGAYEISTAFARSAVPDLRAQGRIGSLAMLLVNLSFVTAGTGDTRAAVQAGEEGVSLAQETGQPSWALTGRLCVGLADALRGNGDAALVAADLGESVLLPAKMHPMLCLVQQIRGVQALAAGRPEDAYRQLHRMFDPGDITYHPYVRFGMVGHLAEAAVLSGAQDELRGVVAELEPVAERSLAPSLIAGLCYARAVLADDADGYRAALATDLSAWPLEQARLQLAHGTWLRRQRQAAESRPVLRAAAASFDALGVTPWADRARAELRATGETRRKPLDAIDELTPQERHIARLAAEGLSNREIAERLFLSPRTVSTHLYRIYPKVGVKSRGELAAFLTERPL
ncbi:helix-turn-helix transcriptional regulator [Actinoplanes friuliensis]|uniref:Putative LuxR-family transcriptional regulator n=1 Tax=Actinoplanes friuliensis DSM 7358 TaxID=1246995 RepID=U5VWM5_9ACTN|nr:LuxR family transcriptional regulator [Actinoplanes friuliensis]AGZ41192.1 putative LuxR-family transcriptional regulator [Actinoplanes friuliensis DSM 7358]